MRFTLTFPDLTVKKILNLHASGKLNLNPGFQRASVWEDKDKALLIDSIFQNVPLPSILLWHEKKGNKNIYHVVDGKQRIETLIAFTKSNKAFSYDCSVVKKHHGNKDWGDIYEDIDDKVVSYKGICQSAKDLRRQFNKFPILAVQIENANSLEDIRELFVRVNSTGMKLHPSEIRHARFLNSMLLLEAERISTLPSIKGFFIDNKVFTKRHFNRMKVVEFITELMLSIKSNDVLDKKASIDSMMDSKLTDTQVKTLSKQVISIIDYISTYFSGKECRLKTTRFKNTADLYALAFCLWKMNYTSGLIIKDHSRSYVAYTILVDLDNQIKRYSVAYKEGKVLRALPDVERRYKKTIVSSTDSGLNRRERVSIIDDLLRPVFIKKDADRVFSRDLKELLWHSTDRICTLCREKILKYEDLEIDHRFAHARGGETNSANAQIAHSKCNKSKGKN